MINYFKLEHLIFPTSNFKHTDVRSVTFNIVTPTVFYGTLKESSLKYFSLALNNITRDNYYVIKN